MPQHAELSLLLEKLVGSCLTFCFPTLESSEPLTHCRVSTCPETNKAWSCVNATRPSAQYNLGSRVTVRDINFSFLHFVPISWLFLLLQNPVLYDKFIECLGGQPFILYSTSFTVPPGWKCGVVPLSQPTILPCEVPV